MLKIWSPQTTSKAQDHTSRSYGHVLLQYQVLVLVLPKVSY